MDLKDYVDVSKISTPADVAPLIADCRGYAKTCHSICDHIADRLETLRAASPLTRLVSQWRTVNHLSDQVGAYQHCADELQAALVEAGLAEEKTTPPRCCIFTRLSEWKSDVCVTCGKSKVEHVPAQRET